MTDSPTLLSKILSRLQEQRRRLLRELAVTHNVLSKLCRQLAQLEATLGGQSDKHLSRNHKRRLHWARTTARQAVQVQELRRHELHEQLRQCEVHVSACEEQAYYHLPSTLWTAHLPSSPFPSFALAPRQWQVQYQHWPRQW